VVVKDRVAVGNMRVSVRGEGVDIAACQDGLRVMWACHGGMV
jgi:hypothetical protein